jgi:hypothetical protein
MVSGDGDQAFLPFIPWEMIWRVKAVLGLALLFPRTFSPLYFMVSEAQG